MTSSLSTRDPARSRLRVLAAILFMAYLCIGMSLPIVPIFVTGALGFGNAWAGLGVGIAFLATVATRSHAGQLSDQRGAKTAVMRGLAFYMAGALVCLAAGLLAGRPGVAFAVLVAGRLLLGLGESLVAVGVIAWGIGLVGPARSGEVLSLVGAAIYGALAVGGPIGLAVAERFGFAGAMAACTLLPGLGLLALWRMAGVAAPPGGARPSFWTVIGRIWPHGSVVCLQGIGFAAIGAFFALYFMSRGWGHAGFGLTAFGGGFVLVRVFLGHLPDRLGGLRVAAGSLVVEAIGQALIWGAADPAWALAGAFLSGLGCSMIFPAMGREVVHRVPAHLRGTALGGFAAFQDVSYGLTGPVVGLLADRAGYGSIFLVGGVAAGLGVVLVLRLRGSGVA